MRALRGIILNDPRLLNEFDKTYKIVNYISKMKSNLVDNQPGLENITIQKFAQYCDYWSERQN